MKKNGIIGVLAGVFLVIGIIVTVFTVMKKNVKQPYVKDKTGKNILMEKSETETTMKNISEKSTNEKALGNLPNNVKFQLTYKDPESVDPGNFNTKIYIKLGNNVMTTFSDKYTSIKHEFGSKYDYYKYIGNGEYEYYHIFPNHEDENGWVQHSNTIKNNGLPGNWLFYANPTEKFEEGEVVNIKGVGNVKTKKFKTEKGEYYYSENLGINVKSVGTTGRVYTIDSFETNVSEFFIAPPA